MLSKRLRVLTIVLAVLYTILGAVLFVAPAWSAANFAWKITAFVAMTIGGWCIGNAIAAWDASRSWDWESNYPNLIYLWVFGLTETAVLLEFRSRLILSTPVSWLYLLTLGVNVLAAALGIIEWIQTRPSPGPLGPPVRGWVRGFLIAFALLVGVLVLLGITARPDTFLTNGGIFPENLTLFTIHAFAAFYFSLMVASISLFRAQGIVPVTSFLRFGIALIIPITAAALINLDKFDFTNHPGGLLYIGAYLVALVSALIILAAYRTERISSGRSA